jgi:dTDP-4-dehydrorhamnose 3,5-epimerase
MIVDLNKFDDDRGSLTCVDVKKWNQVNVSVNNKKSTFRGMHYQERPRQEKQIIVTQGKIIDFIYDLKTKTLEAYHLSEGESVFVNKHSAHGFLTLEDNTIVTYLVKGKYNPSREKSIVWKDIPHLKTIILSNCKESELVISEKDNEGK